MLLVKECTSAIKSIKTNKITDYNTMQINKLHEWNLGIEQARSIQKNLRAWLVFEDQFDKVKSIARVKTQSIKGEALVKAKVSLISYPDLKLIEKQSASLAPEFAGASGLMSFRHAQVIVEALKKLKRTPDLIICDGQGLIDANSFGLASHIGLLAQTPTIGLRKPSRGLSLVSSIENERGAWLPLTSPTGDMVIGSIVRVGKDTAPIQASPGHAISVKSAVKYALDCFPKEINKNAEASIAIDINKAKKKASAH